MVTRLLYKSKAAFPPYSVVDVDILRQAAPQNSENSISGFLVRSGWDYLQILEGPEPHIRSLAARIREDERHFGFHEILQDETTERSFVDWSMGYLDLSGGKSWLTKTLPDLTCDSSDDIKQMTLIELKRTALEQERRL
ncbi:hypothetical protein AB838_15620 [Rhodobacteraceae bacterium (ex Bugula neritina AB1)]|nr:hypothetical protein AB838_15620 [Rhodobacteraceae bacterium (ex Bugula neritina AB1)]